MTQPSARITRKQLDDELAYLCNLLGCPGRLYIDANNPGDGWRGRIEEVDTHRTPFGPYRYSKRELFWLIAFASTALEYQQSLKETYR
jgi:hypothetical protein